MVKEDTKNIKKVTWIMSDDSYNATSPGKGYSLRGYAYAERTKVPTSSYIQRTKGPASSYSWHNKAPVPSYTWCSKALAPMPAQVHLAPTPLYAQACEGKYTFP